MRTGNPVRSQMSTMMVLGTMTMMFSTIMMSANAFGSTATSSSMSAFLPQATVTTKKTQRSAVHPIISTKLQMANDDEDDEEDGDDGYDNEPLKDGVNSISWLPSLNMPISTDSTTDNDDIKGEKIVLPLFPLGNIVYTPSSEHVLNIFEPRYRQMYTDILMNGSKRFIVAMSHPEQEGTFAQVGALFYLDDLKEVSEQTGDQIKYICNHRVTGRVKIHRILNPEVWNTRESYLRVECTILEDESSSSALSNEEDDDDNVEDLDEAMSSKNADIYSTLAGNFASSQSLTKEESKFKQSFASLVNKQHEMEEDIRFTQASVNTLAMADTPGETGLWTTVRLWQSFIEQRLMGRQNEMQREFQEKLIAYLKQERGLDDKELPSAIGFEDLSPALQEEIQDLQKRMQVELQPLILESTLAIQKVLEAEDHTARVNLLRYFVEAEKSRLDAKNTLQGMFSGSSTAVMEDFVEQEEPVALEKEVVAEKKKSTVVEDVVVEKKKDEKKEAEVQEMQGGGGSIFMDEPDAFQ